MGNNRTTWIRFLRIILWIILALVILGGFSGGLAVAALLRGGSAVSAFFLIAAFSVFLALLVVGKGFVWLDMAEDARTIRDILLAWERSQPYSYQNQPRPQAPAPNQPGGPPNPWPGA